MSTKFDKVYKQYFELTDDLDIKKIYSIDYAYKVLWDYLEYGISVFGDYCFKDLNKYTPFQRLFDSIIGGTTNVITLNITPPVNSEFYITIEGIEGLDGTEVLDYTYNQSTNEITINNLVILNKTINVVAYLIGEFTEDLNTQEINLLAELMTIPFKKNKLNKTILLNQSVHGQDFNINSPANHIKEVRSTIEYDEKNMLKKIKRYSWKQNKTNVDTLHG